MKSLKLALFLVLIPLTFVSAQSVEVEPFEPLRYEYRPGKFNGEGQLVEKGEISEILDQLIQDTENEIERISQIPSQERTFSNTVEAFEFVLAKLRWGWWSIRPAIKIATDPLVIKEAEFWETKMEQFLADIRLRTNMAQAFQEFCGNTNSDLSSLTADEQALVEYMRRLFKQSGALLKGADYETVRTETEELQSSITTFGQNLKKRPPPLLFSELELVGLAHQEIQDFPKVDVEGQVFYEVKITPTNFMKIMQYAVFGQTREKMQAAWLTRGPQENMDLLLDALSLRDHIAKKIGYASWPDLKADGRMVENAEGIQSFFTSVLPGITQKNREILEELLKIKRETEPDAKRIEAADISFFLKKLEERKFGADLGKRARDYFTFNRLIEALPQIISMWLGVTISEMTDVNLPSGRKLFRVSDIKSGAELGHFYTDMYAIEGRDNQFMAFTIPGGIIGPGSKKRPVSIVHGGYERSTDDKQICLTPLEVETFLHEVAGHVMHFMSSTVSFVSLTEGIAWDFIEVPSTVAQKLIWRRDILDMISGHYQTGEKLPEDLRQKILASKQYTAAVDKAAHLFFAVLDFELHVNPSQDIPTLIKNLYEDIRGVPLPKGGEQVLTSMNHIMAYDYDVCLYGYDISEVCADSLLEEFDGDKLWQNGRRYREMVLAHQGRRNPKELMREFKGQELTPEPYFRNIGINPSPLVVSQDGTLDIPETNRSDISKNLPREMKRTGLRRGEDVARAENTETKKGKSGVREWISRHIPRFKFFRKILVLEPS
ncbi:MAG TPA: M3 family metallopeptidase [Bdellovibrionota bacterium]|nr:M3 family metallopeptidase [Bdellovibrionota bacterium]